MRAWFVMLKWLLWLLMLLVLCYFFFGLLQCPTCSPQHNVDMLIILIILFLSHKSWSRRLLSAVVPLGSTSTSVKLHLHDTIRPWLINLNVYLILHWPQPPRSPHTMQLVELPEWVLDNCTMIEVFSIEDCPFIIDIVHPLYFFHSLKKSLSVGQFSPLFCTVGAS